MIEKIINIIANSVGWDKAKVDIQNTNEAQKDLNTSTKEYDSTITKAEKALIGFLGNVNVLGVNLGSTYKSLKQNITGFSDLNKGVKAVTAGVKLQIPAWLGLAGAIAATGIGAIVVALGALVAALLTTQEGLDKVQRVVQPIIFQFQTFFGVIQDVGKALMRFDFKGAIKGFDGIGSKLKEAGDRGREYQANIERLRKTKIEYAKIEGELTDTLANLNDIVQDNTLSEEERVKAANDAIEAFNKLKDAEMELVAIELELLRAKQANNDTSDEELLKLAELEAQYNKLNAEKTRFATQTNKKINQIEKQAATERNRIAKEEEAERLRIAKEAEDLRIQFLENKQSFEDKLRQADIDKIEDAEKRKLEQIQFNSELEKRAIEDKYNELFTLYDKDSVEYAELLTQKQQLLDIAEEERLRKQEEISNIELQKQLAFEEKKVEQRRQFLLEEEARNLETEEEKLQFELEREIERLTALREAGVITDEEFDNLKLQREQELADEISRIQLEADRATQMAKVQNAQMYFGAVANLSKDLFEFSNNIGKKDEASQLERAKRQFKVNKAFELGQAGIGGARAVISALGAPFPLNLVQLPIAIATTAASIAKIASAQFDPGATGDDAAPTLETPNLSATPNPELFGTGVDTNETTLGGSTTLTQPREQLIKAVVVESDITETRDRLDLIESGAEL
jgi:hypothetical protein